MEATQQTTTTLQAHPQEAQWVTRYGVATWVTMRVITTPITLTPSLAFEPEPPPLLGTLTGMLEQYVSYGVDQVERTMEGIE
jgi:hypothetical protein